MKQSNQASSQVWNVTVQQERTKEKQAALRFSGNPLCDRQGGKQRLRAQKLYAMKQGQTAPHISGEAPEGMYGEATALSRHMIRKHLHQCYKQAVKSTEPRKD